MPYRDHQNPDAVVYTTPCHRWSVERAGTSRYVVYGPSGRPVGTETEQRDAEELACIMAGKEKGEM